jgi:hypothetical protein
MISIAARVFRLKRDGTMIMDTGPGAWSLSLFDLWVARFSNDWRNRYPTTWAVGYGSKHIWFYSPSEKVHAD